MAQVRIVIYLMSSDTIAFLKNAYKMYKIFKLLNIILTYYI